jgi:hypothetical protein
MSEFGGAVLPVECGSRRLDAHHTVTVAPRGETVQYHPAIRRYPNGTTVGNLRIFAPESTLPHGGRRADSFL